MSTMRSVGVRQGIVKADTLKYAEGRRGGFDPHARIVDMDADGIDAAFLYPSLDLSERSLKQKIPAVFVSKVKSFLTEESI